MQERHLTSHVPGPSDSDVGAGITAVDSPLLLTTTNAAKLLSVSRTTLYNLIAEGSIRPVHIGRSCRVSTAELQRYVDRLQGWS